MEEHGRTWKNIVKHGRRVWKKECEDENYEGRKRCLEIVDRGGKRAGEDRRSSTARRLVVDHCCVIAVEDILSNRKYHTRHLLDLTARK